LQSEGYFRKCMHELTEAHPITHTSMATLGSSPFLTLNRKLLFLTLLPKLSQTKLCYATHKQCLNGSESPDPSTTDDGVWQGTKERHLVPLGERPEVET